MVPLPRFCRRGGMLPATMAHDRGPNASRLVYIAVTVMVIAVLAVVFHSTGGTQAAATMLRLPSNCTYSAASIKEAVGDALREYLEEGGTARLAGSQPAGDAAAGGGGGDSDSGGACKATPEFIEYQPSAWEQEWLNDAQNFQAQPEMVCHAMQQQTDRVDAWLAVSSKPPGVSLGPEPDHAIFSRFKYRDPCTGKEFFAYIEPMVGHFRHPMMPGPCHPPSKPGVDIQDRSYVLLQGGQQQYSRSGKGYLFDLGTADFASSLGWMIEHHALMGIQFNEIWAWEVQNAPPEQYWGTVPIDVQPLLHFYNIPVSVQESDKSNPLNILRHRHQPGDYTVIKLDIDNSAIELALIAQIEADPKLPPLISDIMFEMHYDHPDMAPYFGMNNQKTWQDVITKFHELRSKGLRVHYWP